MASGFVDYSQPPLSYTTPSFPSLYWPFDSSPGRPQYLYSLTDIWKFTVYWTLITIPAAHLLVATWGVLMQFSTASRRRRYLASFDGNGVAIRRVPSRSEKTWWRKWFGAKDERGPKIKQRETEARADPEPETIATTTTSQTDLERNSTEKKNAPSSASPSPPPKLRAERAARPRVLTAKNRKLYGDSPINETLTWVWLIPSVYAVVGSLEALLGGSVVGLVLGAVYNAGYFRMSTWTPFIWGIVNVLVLILGSFRIQGGL